MGSLAFGSLIVAIVWAIRIVFEYINVNQKILIIITIEKSKGCK